MSNILLEKMKDKVNRFKYLNTIIREDIKKYWKNHPSQFNVLARHLGVRWTSLSEKEYNEYLELEDFLNATHSLIGAEINK